MRCACADGNSERQTGLPSFVQDNVSLTAQPAVVRGLHFQRPARMLDRRNALIQADGCLQHRLKFGVIKDIIVGQRLLDQQQIQVVQTLEMLGV